MSEPNPPSQPTPPAPPAPPAPPVPPVPQYGEYAPGGYIAPQPVAGHQPQPAPGNAPYGSASYPAQAGPRQRKTWDLVLTIVLLTLGFFGMGIGLIYAALFTDPLFMDQAMQGTGLSTFNGTVGIAPAVLAISHVVLYLLAIGGALPLLLTKRVAFWVPLTSGVIAAIFFWGALFAVFLSDPAFVATYS
ncbi:MAG: DUF6264 family protein [Rhodoglobus sp.]